MIFTLLIAALTRRSDSKDTKPKGTPIVTLPFNCTLTIKDNSTTFNINGTSSGEINMQAQGHKIIIIGEQNRKVTLKMDKSSNSQKIDTNKLVGFTLTVKKKKNKLECSYIK